MAGKIIADQIEHSTAGSLDTSYVVNGSAKAWVNFVRNWHLATTYSLEAVIFWTWMIMELADYTVYFHLVTTAMEL
jgi:hypothetical protein